MQILKGTITDAKSRYSAVRFRDLVGTDITIVLEEKNDGLLGTLESDKIFNESPLVLRIRPILK
jgi:hypothetical protein